MSILPQIVLPLQYKIQSGETCPFFDFLKSQPLREPLIALKNQPAHPSLLLSTTPILSTVYLPGAAECYRRAAGCCRVLPGAARVAESPRHPFHQRVLITVFIKGA